MTMQELYAIFTTTIYVFIYRESITCIRQPAVEQRGG